MGALGAGRIEVADAAVVHLDRCLACRACEAVCPSGVPYGRLIEATRAGLAARRRAPLAARILLGIAARPPLLDLATRLLGIAERLGLRRLARGFLSSRLRRLDDLAPPTDRPRFRPVAVDAPRGRVALLLGCVMRASYGDIHSATARVLARFGIAIEEAPGQTCCGALAAHAGERGAAVTLAKRNIAAFEASSGDLVLVNAAGCGAHLRSYAHLLEDDPDWRERALALSRRIRDVSEYLAAQVDGARIGALRMRVTYQDPCHLAHAQGIRAEPRALLGLVEGLELVEMADADVCCGSAGYYNVSQPAYADRLLEPKIDAILATGAEAVVTANPGCMLQLQAGLRARGRADVPVLHLVEVLDHAIANA
jgi:glycolate oxidase iron-sulfur subunit